MAWTTADLIAAIRRDAFMPTVADLVDSTRGQFSDAELLAIADQAVSDSFVDRLRALRDESRVLYFDTASTGATMRIDLPARAMVRSIRRVHRVDTQGYEGEEIEPLIPADAHAAVGAGWFGDRRFGWYFEADTMVFPSTPPDGSIRIYYQREFSRLALVSECAKIVTVASTTVTTDDRPTWMAVGEVCDVVRGSSPFPAMEVDCTISALPGASTFTLSPFTVATSVSQPGALVTKRFDYVCKAGETCYPPIPSEWHAALVACVVVRVLESIGDLQAVGPARALRQERLDAIVAATTPRNAGRGEKIVNRGSALRSPRRWGFR